MTLIIILLNFLHDYKPISMEGVMSLPELIELLSEKQAAEYIGGLTPKALQAWRCRGGGPPFFKIGRLIRYERTDLDGWLSTRRRESTADTGRGGR